MPTDPREHPILIGIRNLSPEDAAAVLVKRGFFQISRKYCLLARLPPFKTGIRALIDAEREHNQCHRRDLEDWVLGMGEGGAGDFYLRVWARYDGNVVEVNNLIFAAYRKLRGGDTYASAWWQRCNSPNGARVRLTVDLNYDLWGTSVEAVLDHLRTLLKRDGLHIFSTPEGFGTLLTLEPELAVLEVRESS